MNEVIWVIVGKRKEAKVLPVLRKVVEKKKIEYLSGLPNTEKV